MKFASTLLFLALMLSFVPTGVTSVYAAETVSYDFVAQAASATWSSGVGALTFPGTDGDAKGFGLKLDNPTFENNLTYGNGLLFVPNNATNGFIQAVYSEYKVQSGDHFLAQIGCQSGATNCYVEYRLQYQIGTGAVTTFSRPKFPFPFRERNEGLTYPVNVDLSSLAGQSVKFILWVSAVPGFGSAAGNRALWGNPRIVSGGVVVTPPPTSCTDRALFVSDLDVADGKIYAPNQAFTKSWQLKNIGTCTWTTAYQLVYDSGDKMNGPDTAPMPISVSPGQTVSISLSLKSPITAGTYKGFWKFKNNNGTSFGLCPFGNCFLGSQKSFWVQINVVGAYPNP
jgi:hypothetical protein